MLESQIVPGVNGPNLFVDYATEMAGSSSGMAIPLRVQYRPGKKLTRIRAGFCSWMGQVRKRKGWSQRKSKGGKPVAP